MPQIDRLPAMTEMSERRCAQARPAASRQLKSLTGSALARRVHASCSPVRPALPLVLLAGCIIPPSLSTGEDGVEKQNSPPMIRAVSTDAEKLFEPGPMALTKGQGTIRFELLDTDVDDVLVVGVFIGYDVDDPKPARAQCTAPPTDQPERSLTCSASAICQSMDTGSRLHMTTVVFDRELAESGEPRFQAMKDDKGLSTSRFFFVDCMDGTP